MYYRTYSLSKKQLAKVVENAIVQLNMCLTAHGEDGHLISQLHVLGFFSGRGRN